MPEHLPLSQPFRVWGTFWWPANRSRQSAGELSWSADEGLVLTVQDWLLDSNAGDGEVLHANINGEFWTLADCLMTSSGSGGQTIVVDCGLRGAAVEPDKLDQFDEMSISYSGMHWLCNTPTPKLLSRSQRDEHRHADLVVSVAHLPPLVAHVQSGSLTLAAEPTFTREGPDSHLGTHPKWIVQSSRPTSMHELLQVATSVQQLLQLAAQRAVPITSLGLDGEGTTVAERGGRAERRTCYAYLALTPLSREQPTPTHPPALLIPNDPAEFTALLSRWFTLVDQVETPLAIRMSLLSDRPAFAEPAFLTCAQALESLHRHAHGELINEDAAAKRAAVLGAVAPEHAAWVRQQLHRAHEPSLRMRMEQLVADIEPLGAELFGDLTSRFVSRFVTSRNRLVHWEPGLGDIDGSELFALRHAGCAMFDLWLMSRLGLDHEALRRTVTSRRPFKDVQHYLTRFARL